MTKLRWEIWWGFASIAGMVLGAFGPWLKATAGFASVSIAGTDGSNDGWLVVAAALIGAVWLILVAVGHSRKLSLITLLCGIGGAVVAVYDRSNLQDRASDSELFVQIGWGLNLAMGASVSLAIASLVLLLRDETAPQTATATKAAVGSESRAIATVPASNTPIEAMGHAEATSEPESRSQAKELEELGSLHARGVLTDEEFQAAKARLLGL